MLWLMIEYVLLAEDLQKAIHTGVAAEQSQAQPNPFTTSPNPFQQGQGLRAGQASSSNIGNPFKSWTEPGEAAQPNSNLKQSSFPAFRGSTASGNLGSWGQQQGNEQAPVFAFGSAAPRESASSQEGLAAANEPNGFSMTPGNRTGSGKDKTRRRHQSTKASGLAIKDVLKI